VNRPDFGLVESLNHRVFSVHAMGDDTLWVGTAGGINLSTDGGLSWRRFAFNNQSAPISGNFVVSIGHNVIDGVTHVWAATINALNPDRTSRRQRDDKYGRKLAHGIARRIHA
jgi:ligand-binding sensor domain-containing protein